MLHRAILGSMERFIGILLEHHEGDLPEWLAPVQAIVIPVEERHESYASKIRSLLGSDRVEVDASGRSMSDRVKRAISVRPPFVIVVGDREMEADSISVRRRGSRRSMEMPLASFTFESPPE